MCNSYFISPTAHVIEEKWPAAPPVELIWYNKCSVMCLVLAYNLKHLVPGFMIAGGLMFPVL